MAASHIAKGLRLLKNPNVNRMFVAYLISYTGTAMAPIAMAFGVLELTGSAADAGTMNIKLTGPSRTMFFSESRRLLPRQSGSHRVLASEMRTTSSLSPLGLASVPSGPTVKSTTKRDAMIQRRYRGVR